jgi:hypothetical protein
MMEGEIIWFPWDYSNEATTLEGMKRGDFPITGAQTYRIDIDPNTLRENVPYLIVHPNCPRYYEPSNSPIFFHITTYTYKGKAYIQEATEICYSTGHGLEGDMTRSNGEVYRRIVYGSSVGAWKMIYPVQLSDILPVSAETVSSGVVVSQLEQIGIVIYKCGNQRTIRGSATVVNANISGLKILGTLVPYASRPQGTIAMSAYIDSVSTNTVIEGCVKSDGSVNLYIKGTAGLSGGGVIYFSASYLVQ